MLNRYFSFTPQGMLRFADVYERTQLGTLETVLQLIRNYFSYFSPKFFILSQYDDKTLHVNIAHLNSVGLLSWFEFVLIILGIVVAIVLRKKSSWFILYWLVVSAIGINLHSNSPWPTLWLTVIPIPHVLAGAGFAGLVYIIIGRSSFIILKQPIVLKTVKVVAALLLLGISVGVFINFGRMYNDLFFEFPIYGAREGREDAIQLLEDLKGQYDEVTVPADGLSTSIYLLFYNRYDPATRHAELKEFPDKTWQKVGNYNIGEVEEFIHRPGCHLILTTVAHSKLLKPQIPQLIPVREFYLPSGEPGVGLYASVSPLPQIVESGTVFGNQIVLQGYGVSSNGDLTNLNPGDTICFILQWQALNDLHKDLTFFAHLTGPYDSGSPDLWAQHDAPPLHGVEPTSTWRAGDVVQDIHRLTIPIDIPDGKYHIDIGMYDFFTGERIPVNTSQGEDDRLQLIELEIQSE